MIKGNTQSANILMHSEYTRTEATKNPESNQFMYIHAFPMLILPSLCLSIYVLDNIVPNETPQNETLPILLSCFLGAWDGLRYFIVALPEPSI